VSEPRSQNLRRNEDPLPCTPKRGMRGYVWKFPQVTRKSREMTLTAKVAKKGREEMRPM
jgi:hypothetical protein